MGWGILFSVTTTFVTPGSSINVTFGFITAGGARMGVVGGAAMGPTIASATGGGGGPVG